MSGLLIVVRNLHMKWAIFLDKFARFRNSVLLKKSMSSHGLTLINCHIRRSLIGNRKG
jgi:hypothetical protein